MPIRRAFERLSPPGRPTASGGFTLIELVLVMALLVMVLTVAYNMIVDCLEADRTIDRLTKPEKVGEGILSLLRADLSGVIWRHLGTRVFFVTDGGNPPDARDEIRFVSTVEPTPREESVQGSTIDVVEFRTITGVGYFLRQNTAIQGAPAFTLFRKEIIDLTTESPLDGPGQNYEVYDKVAYLGFECFDGFGWSPSWDSAVQIQLEQTALSEEAAALEQGVPRVSDTRTSGAGGLTPAPGVDPTALEGQGPLPPAAVPVAVRIEIGIYTGNGNQLELSKDGHPILKTYSTIVSILTAQRVPIEIEDDMSLEGGAEGDGMSDLERSGGAVRTFGASAPGASGAASGRGGPTPGRSGAGLRGQGPRGQGGGPRGAPPRGGGRAPAPGAPRPSGPR
ncbi:MAG TPA: prepilin-type N-terminal cleavage/methylation domain-containing protein [Planctomycetota bacterium]|nr:prepilin-type N-terminal cleavage/methylation domain-containing protein [Planctomycetota bacterium]